MYTLDIIVDELKRKNLSQKELTDHLGLSKNIFTNWKAGKSNSYLKYINKIAEFLDVSADYLLSTGIKFAYNEQDGIDYETLKMLFCKCFGDEYESLIHDFQMLTASNKEKICNYTADLVSLQENENSKIVAGFFNKLSPDKQEIIINTMKGFIGG